MSLVSLAYTILAFWSILHGVRHFLVHRTSRPSKSILPTAFAAPGQRHRWFHLSHLRITLQTVHLKLETTGFNNCHDGWTAYFNKRSHAVVRRNASLFYNLGSIAGLLGMFASVILLWLTVYRSLLHLPAYTARMPDSDHNLAGNTLSRRDYVSLDGATSPADMETSRVPLQIILPGVTVPLSHLPLLLVALLFSQVIHELGHAVTAALESVPLTYIGVSLSLVIPSAFVSLPAAPVHALPVPSRLRIISSGAFHNLIFWGLLSISSTFDLGHLVWTNIGYADISHYGRVVVAVHQSSPLVEYLPIGSVITELDDQSVALAELPPDGWSSLLLNSKPDRELGWCVGGQWFLAHPGDCCIGPNSTTSQAACFGADDPTSDSLRARRCVPSLSILQPDDVSPKRCEESAHCAPHSLCVKLEENAQLLRIKFHMPPKKKTAMAVPEDDAEAMKTVIWSGPPSELLDEGWQCYELCMRIEVIIYLVELMAALFEYTATL
ncbi:hypothetical protein BDW22DRAFT_1382221, partial [Trametopsis cervina]